MPCSRDFIRTRVRESDAWREHRTDWATYGRSLGVLCAASIPYLEGLLGERLYASDGRMVTAVLIGGALVTYFGTEAHGVTFRKVKATQ